MVSLAEITSHLIRFGYVIMLILGITGHLLNILTFLSKDFGKNVCVFYMICSTILDLFAINGGIIPIVLIDYAAYNIPNANRFTCKIYYHVVFLFWPAMASTCLFLMTFDRCLSTSRNVRWRRLSSIPFARRLFTVTLLFLFVSSAFCWIVYDLSDGICTTTSSTAAMAVVVYGNIFISLIPHGGMIICSIVAWIHIRQLAHRINPNTTSNNESSAVQRMNRQLFILIFVQAGVAVILEFQRNIVATYSLITSSMQKSIEHQQIEYLITHVSIILYTIKYSFSFYLNYMCSSMFRKTFHKCVKSLVQRCFRFDQHN
ncbi:unnamed protein product [Adineta ricciae]|uniref:G-protein coupled receptors family 1 profile domain-containing protein n=1 Tax=Adineta ricciae TaxID=249248 RepID=A0A815TC28_ADIRI|nr:unnamed protein product [Adineta ricciae]